MPFAVTCPKCAYGFRVPDGVRGKRGKCPKCQAVFIAQPASEKAPAAASAQAEGETASATPEAKSRAIPKPRMLAAIEGDAPPTAAATPPPRAKSAFNCDAGGYTRDSS